MPSYTRELVVEKGYPKIDESSYRVKGVFKTGAGDYDFQQEIKKIDADTVSYEARLNGSPAKETKKLYLSIALPIADYRGQKILFDKVACLAPWWLKDEKLFAWKGQAGKVSTVRIPLKKGGTLLIGGDLKLVLRDNRTWNDETYILEIGFTPDQGKVREAKLDLTLKRIPASDLLAVTYNKDARKPVRAKAAPAKPIQFEPDKALIAATWANVKPLAPLRPARRPPKAAFPADK